MIFVTGTENWKIQTLPLARIKKIMKSEEFILQELEKERLQKEREQRAAAGEVEEEGEKPVIKFMISGEAPILMSKACELLIKDLSFRAWRHTERNRRRTLQRQDLHAAVGESEVYDFLIDIVPRVTTTTTTSSQKTQSTAQPPPLPPAVPGLVMTNATSMTSTGLPPAMQMQMHGMHSGLPAAAAMNVTQGAPVDNSTLMQHIENQQQQQQQQQQSQQPQHHHPQQQYHHDPQHVSQQQQYHHHQPLAQHHHAFAAAGLPQDGTQRGSSPLWLQHTVNGGQTAGHASSHPS
jgi:nuclear transcription factor Y gamma